MVQLEASRPDQLPEVVRFLTGVFKLTDAAPFVEPRLLQWKYFTPHPFWDGSRSYVLKRDENYAAHGCVAPLIYETPAGGVTSFQIIDWAGGSILPGAGGLLMRDLMKLWDSFLAIGGSDQAQRVMTLFKELTPQTPLTIHAKPVAPWRRPVSWSARGLGKTARAFAWSFPASRAPASWSAQRSTEVSQDDVLRMPSTLGITPLRRSAALIQYLLACPAAAMEFYWLKRGTERAGFFMLSRLQGQTRIADLVVQSTAPQDWLAGYQAATAEAARGPGVMEVGVGTSAAFLIPILQECGFRSRGAYRVFLGDRAKKLAGEPPIEVNLTIGDAFYLQDPLHPLWI